MINEKQKMLLYWLWLVLAGGILGFVLARGIYL